jgi:hypothetical protein
MWQRPADGKGPFKAKSDGKTKGTLKTKAPRWQMPFDGKGKQTLEAKALRWQRPRWQMPSQGKGPSIAMAKVAL